MTFYDRLIRALLLRRRHSSGLRTEESRRAFLRTMVLGGATLPFVPGALERIALSSRRPSNRELLRLIGQKDQAAFAQFVSPVILQVIDQAPIMSDLFTTETYHHDWTVTRIGDAPTIPLNFSWGMPSPGNLPHSEIVASL